MTCMCGDSECSSCGLAQGTLSSSIPDAAALRRIRERDSAAEESWFNDVNENLPTIEAAFRDRRALLALLDDLIGQAHEGCFVEHDCPAMFACTYIIAQTQAPEESERDDER